ncbi:TIGR00266 family protein [Crocosphaera sp. Alani8]|uniref:TIGR00266 family protein n=1 Tax=Crocosphaera sp. Alani8 TaxID=3038952 RepID=UPI00313EB4CC
MLFKVRCRPAFAALFVTLNPGEKITVKTDSIISMDGEITINTGFCGFWLSALLRKCFGGTDVFVDYLSNETDNPLTVVLSQTTIGDIERIDLSQGSICVQPGVFLAYTKGVKIQNYWAGFGSWLAGEGLFKTKLKGKGRAFIAAYGGVIKTTVYQDLIMSQGHLLAYSSKTRLKYRKKDKKVNLTVSGFQSKNKRTQGVLIYYQSRNLQGLINYLRSLV